MPALTGWIAYGWTQPIYYTYGTGGNVYYENNVVYVNGEEHCSADQYYQQAATIAESVPEISDEQAEKIEWLPLGVFAITEGGVSESNMMLQLAVSKEGIIAGTYYNDLTDSARPVEGTVEKETQRAAWTFADGKDTQIVMETSVYNLTKDQCTALVHFGMDQTQTWTLIRQPEPQEPQQPTTIRQ